MLRGRSRFVFFAIACALVVAVVTLGSAPQSVFPNISLARVELFADAGDLVSEDVRRLVAAPLEGALATLPGIRATRAYASPGKLEIECDFDPASDTNADLAAVRAAADRLRSRLPVTNVTTVIEGPEAEPVVTYAFTSPALRQSDLERRVRGALLATFAATPGLGRLTVFGGPREAYAVTLDADRLAALGISARGVASALAAANEPHAAAPLVRGDERLTVRSGGTLTNAASIADLRVPDPTRNEAVPLHALGTVSLTNEPTGTQASFDATHAVLLNAYAVPNGDAVALARAVDARLPLLRAALGPSVRVTLAWDQTRLILASQRALAVEMCLGAAIALLAIALFLRDLPLTLCAAIVLPATLLITAAAIVRGGLRLDLMTIGGLAIAIGLVADETIVVVESIARALDAGPAAPRDARIAVAVRRITRPLVASTAANLVVFLPLAFLGGVPGFFFRALALTLATALVVSIVLSLAVAPTLATVLGARPRATPPPRRSAERGYVAVLRWSLRRPYVAYATALAAVILAALLLARTPVDFLPNVDEGQFEIKYALPPGMSLAAADALATNFERSIMLDPAVAHVARLSGVDTNGYAATPPDAGTMRVTVRESARDDSFDAIADRVRNEIRNYDPNARVEVHQLLEDQINDLSGAPEPIQLTVTGPDQTELAKLAGALADDIEALPGIADTFDGVTWEPRSVYAAPRAGDASSPAAFADDLRARVEGITATEIASPTGPPLPVVVRIADRVPLARRVRLGAPDLSTTIEEDDGRRVVRVTADLENAPLGPTIARVEKAISYAVRTLPPGYAIRIGGAVDAQRAAFAEFATIFAIALALVFGVLVATFDSFRLPFVVLAAVPLTPVGVALALALTRTPLNVASFMGMLLLTGIVVRNGILLVESANRRAREGASPADAMEFAGTERLRPIAMTTLATLGALAPLALGFGAGSELERPLAIAVIGGIVTSTALTLLVVPLLYVALSPIGRSALAKRMSGG
jgi:multidrug efflux pump subunit AcrB